MNKPNRTNINYGGGGGCAAFKSKLFSVTLWKHGRGGTSTTVKPASFGLFIEARFDGDCTDYFKTDCKCISAMNPSEILTMIKQARSDGNDEGKREIRDGFKKLIGG